MEMPRKYYLVLMTNALFLFLLLPWANAAAPAPAPLPSNDGMSLDQGIAYVLMLIALLITYMIH